MASPFMTEAEASEYLGIARSTLSNWRCKTPDRLPFAKQGRIVRYSREVVESFFAAKEKPAGGAAGQTNN